MKKAYFITLLMLIVAAGSTTLNGQCNPDNFANACIPKLASGFNFLKSYKVDGEGGSKEKVEYSKYQ